MVLLKKIDAKNFWDIIGLDVEESQRRFVASNLFSLAQAYITVGTECTTFPFGIYDEDKPVGLVLIGFNETALFDIRGEEAPKVMKDNYMIMRLMVDKNCQKKGYGRAALKLALDFVRTWPCGKAEYCAISYKTNNLVAKELYRSFGFEENGEMDKDEAIAVLKL